MQVVPSPKLSSRAQKTHIHRCITPSYEPWSRFNKCLITMLRRLGYPLHSLLPICWIIISQCRTGSSQPPGETPNSSVSRKPRPNYRRLDKDHLHENILMAYWFWVYDLRSIRHCVFGCLICPCSSFSACFYTCLRTICLRSSRTLISVN